VRTFGICEPQFKNVPLAQVCDATNAQARDIAGLKIAFFLAATGICTVNVLLIKEKHFKKQKFLSFRRAFVLL